MKYVWRGDDVVRFSLKYRLGVADLLAAMPQLHDPGIPRFGQRARSKISAEQNGIRINIGGLRLCFAE